MYYLRALNILDKNLSLWSLRSLRLQAAWNQSKLRSSQKIKKLIAHNFCCFYIRA